MNKEYEGSVWENNPFIDGLFEWMDSPRGQLSDGVSDPGVGDVTFAVDGEAVVAQRRTHRPGLDAGQIHPAGGELLEDLPPCAEEATQLGKRPRRTGQSQLVTAPRMHGALAQMAPGG